MALQTKTVLIVLCIILLLDIRETRGETTDCSILTNIIANCSCEGPEGAPVVYCRNRQLTEVPAIGNTSLYNGTITEFTLYGNLIQHIPDNAFNGLRIRQLDLMENNLINVSDKAFAGLEESLKVLKIAGTGNTSPPFTAIRNLTSLLELTMEKYIVPNNEISNSPFLSLTKLTTLRLDNWNIKSLEQNVFNGLSKMTTLVLTNQPNMTSLPHEALMILTKLKTLEISHSSLSRITDYSFSSFLNLTEIDFSHNLIKLIESRSFSGMAHTLERLDLSFNELPASNLTVLQELVGLQALRLDNIGLVAIPTKPVFLLNKDKLLNLSLARNHINSVQDQTFVTTPNLVRLDLSDNQIITFHEGTFASLPQLEVLLLNNQRVTNNITLPSFVNLTSIQIINLKSSKLDPDTSWDRLKEVTSLKVLNLERTGLNVIKNFTFGDFKNLHTLDLSENSILTITSESFFGLKDSLTNLFLVKNRIQTVDRCTFHNFSTNLKLHLVGNPLNCDCRLRWLRSAQLADTISLGGFEQCSLPVSKLFTDMALNDFVCNFSYTEPECYNYYTTTPLSTTTTSTTTTLPPVHIKASIIGTTETTITVSWIIPQSSLVYIVGIYVEHEDLSNPANRDQSERLNPNVNQYEIRGLQAGTRYEITVKAMRVDNLTDSDSIQSPTKSRPVFTTPAPASKRQTDDSEIGIIIGAIIGGVIFLAILVAILYLIFIRRKPVKDTSPVQPRTFTPAELPSIGYDSKRYIRKKKDKKDQVAVNVISDGKTDNGVHVGRVSAGSYQCLDLESGKRVSNEVNHDDNRSTKPHSYVNEMQPRSTNEYANDIDVRKLPRVPAEYQDHATKSGGYYNPSFRNSTQEGGTPNEYSEINL